MMRFASFFWFTTMLLGIPSASSALAPRPNAVLVIGALHDLHAREPDFDHAVLGNAISAFQPDIMVLEVRPDELTERAATPGRPEYPAVVWPLLDRPTGRAIAMEPGGEAFEQLSSQAGTAFAEFRRANPAGAAALSKLQAAADTVLLDYWKSPGQTQDGTTGAIVRAVQSAQFDLAGPEFAQIQARWDSFMIERARDAVASNPGKRVLILASFRNRHLIEAGLRGIAPDRLVDAKSWLDAGR